MRHERALDKSKYSKVDAGSIWPAGPQVMHLPIAGAEERGFEAPALATVTDEPVFTPTPAAPDVPAAVGMIIVMAYAGLIAAFGIATVASAHSIYAITISALFLVAFFTVPSIFLKMEPKAGRRPSLDRFMRNGIDTLTGHSSGPAALVQMLIVPVFLTFAALAMGVAAAFYI